MIIANTLKVKLNNQQKTNTSWLVIKIKVILKTPIQKIKEPNLSFSRTHEEAVRNSKIIAALKGDLVAEIAVQQDSQ